MHRTNVRPTSYAEQWGMPLDRGISYAVKVMRDGGVETFESCEGGDGHAFLEPTVRFFGGVSAGLRAVSVCVEAGLPVGELRRYWTMIAGELTGPHWEITFVTQRLQRAQEAAEAEGLIG